MNKKLETYPQMNESQKIILWGLILGDGYLGFNGKNAFLIFSQSESHKEYLFSVYEKFSSLTNSPPKERTHVLKRVRGKEIEPIYRKHWRFATKSLPEIVPYYKAFYEKGKKRVPEFIDNFLTPEGLAYWYMDDGSMKSKSSKGCILNTHSFSLGDVERLCKCLSKCFQLKAWPRPQKSPTGVIQYQIYISGWSYNRFRDLIFPFLHKSMHYKFPTPREGGRGFWRETHMPKE